MSKADDHVPEFLQVALADHEVDQMVAEFREEIVKMVNLIRDHQESCDAPACPGANALEEIMDFIKAGPAFALTVLAMSLFYLAQSDFGKNPGLEEILNAKLEAGGVLGEPGPEGGPEPVAP